MTGGAPQADHAISISLTPMQSARVVCDSLANNSLLSLLLALASPAYELRLTTLATLRAYTDNSISHALLHGLLVLSTFTRRPEQTLTQIAEQSELAGAVVRRYLVTLMMVKLVTQDKPQQPYRVAGSDLPSRYGLLPMLLAFATPEREAWLVDALSRNRNTQKSSLALLRGIAALSTFGMRPVQSRDDVAERLGENPTTVGFCLRTLTAVGLLEYGLERYRVAEI